MRIFHDTTKKLAYGLGVLLAATLCSPSANAGSITDNWTITGAGITGSGTITLATTGNPAVDDVTGITGFFSTTNNGGFSGAITGLNPGSYSSTAPTTDALSATYDNLFYPSGSAPVCAGFTPLPAPAPKEAKRNPRATPSPPASSPSAISCFRKTTPNTPNSVPACTPN